MPIALTNQALEVVGIQLNAASEDRVSWCLADGKTTF